MVKQKQKNCYCTTPDLVIKKSYYCEQCGGSLRHKIGTYSFRGDDECDIQGGITDFSGKFKIWKCKHHVYCPLCHWRCKNVDELKRHLEGFSNIDDNKRLCDGFFYYGQYTIDIVINEIKYYKLKKQKIKK